MHRSRQRVQGALVQYPGCGAVAGAAGEAGSGGGHDVVAVKEADQARQAHTPIGVIRGRFINQDLFTKGPGIHLAMHQRTVDAYLNTTLLLLLVLTAVALGRPSTETHLALNRFTDPAFDRWFAWGTYLADGWVPTVIGLVLLFVRWRWFLLLAMSTLGSSIVVQLLKRTVFASIDRPLMFLDHMPGLRTVPGVEMHLHNSFPSGHTTCAFSMCLALAIMVGRPWAGVLLALFAGLLGSTRIYLSQHFLQDVILGAVLGTVCAWYAYRLCYAGPLSTKPWIDRRPIGRQNQ